MNLHSSAGQEHKSNECHSCFMLALELMYANLFTVSTLKDDMNSMLCLHKIFDSFCPCAVTLTCFLKREIKVFLGLLRSDNS